MTRVSRRADRVPPMELAGLMRTAAATGAIDIALGFPPGRPPDAVVAAARAALDGPGHQYADPAGLFDLRAALAAEIGRFRGMAVDPENEITITCGATEALFVALLAVTDPGDEVVVIEPYFEIYPGMVAATGAVPRFAGLAGPDWRLDVDAIRRVLTPRTRAVLLNSPHNPTGRAFDETELTELLRLCAEADLTCVVDEVYERTMFTGQAHRSPTQLPGGRERTIVAGSLSKTLHMSGWRVGYCVAPPEVTAVLRRMHERTTVGTSHPLQAGAAALTGTDIDGYASLFARRRDDMVSTLDDLGFEVRPPDGGWFVFAGTRRLGWPASVLARRLVTEAGVLLAPGTAFFSRPADGEGWVRTTFVRDEAATRTALARLGEFLRSEPAPMPVAAAVGST